MKNLEKDLRGKIKSDIFLELSIEKIVTSMTDRLRTLIE